MHIDGSTSSVFSSSSSTLPPVSTPPLGSQFRHAHKIVRRSHPPSRQLRSLGSPIPRFSKSSHRLGPAKDLFNSLSYPLTDTVALMARSECGHQWPNRPCAWCWLLHEQRSFGRAKNQQSRECRSSCPLPTI